MANTYQNWKLSKSLDKTPVSGEFEEIFESFKWSKSVRLDNVMATSLPLFQKKPIN